MDTAQRIAHDAAKANQTGAVWYLAKRPVRSFDYEAAKAWVFARFDNAALRSRVVQWLQIICAVAQ